MLKTKLGKDHFFFINKQIFIATAISAALIIYFISYALFGNKGIIKYFHLTKDLHLKELVKESAEQKMKNKQNMVNGMSSESLDLDLLDEEVRKDLGYAGKQEIVIYDEEIGIRQKR